MSSTNGKTVQVAGEKMTFVQTTILELARRELMRVSDDPREKTPFTIGFNQYSRHEVAAIACAIIRVLAAGDAPPDVTLALEFEAGADCLQAYAQSPQTPF